MRPRVIVIMGVSGSGKTTVGRLLARRLGWDYFDGDDFQPPANIAKMSQGIPLTDEDRAGWLRTLADLIEHRLGEGKPAVLSSSALKRAYRDILRPDPHAVQFVYLKGSYDQIWERIAGRKDHYMPASLLASQFATLEEPQQALVVDISPPPDEIVRTILQEIFSQRRREA